MMNKCLLVAASLMAGWLASTDSEHPAVVTPGEGTAPPSDAIVLLDGTSLAAFQHPDGAAPRWKLEAGAAVVQGGSLVTRESFGDVQLHVEFATPEDVVGEGQGRGNSGVYLQGRYEVQVLDSYRNETYPDGQCAAIYGVAPPLVNASRGPGQWQTYDIVFRTPRFDEAGATVTPARMTVFHNGVLVQDHVAVGKETTAAMNAAGAGSGPLYLQDHGNPVRYRNIWIRRLD